MKDKDILKAFKNGTYRPPPWLKNAPFGGVMVLNNLLKFQASSISSYCFTNRARKIGTPIAEKIYVKLGVFEFTEVLVHVFQFTEGNKIRCLNLLREQYLLIFKLFS